MMTPTRVDFGLQRGYGGRRAASDGVVFLSVGVRACAVVCGDFECAGHLDGNRGLSVVGKKVFRGGNVVEVRTCGGQSGPSWTVSAIILARDLRPLRMASMEFT